MKKKKKKKEEQLTGWDWMLQIKWQPAFRCQTKAAPHEALSLRKRSLIWTTLSHFSENADIRNLSLGELEALGSNFQKNSFKIWEAKRCLPKVFSALRSSNNLLSSHSGAKRPGSCRIKLERKRKTKEKRSYPDARRAVPKERRGWSLRQIPLYLLERRS